MEEKGVKGNTEGLRERKEMEMVNGSVFIGWPLIRPCNMMSSS